MRAPERADALDALATAFDGVAADTDPARLPLLLRVEGPPDPDLDDAVQLGVRHLDGEHPASVLLGFDAPDDWTVLGVASIGWSLPPERFDDADLDRHTFRTERPSTAPDRVRVRSTVLVDRDGEIAGRLTIGDGETISSRPGTGAMIDVLLRVMGCPTPPPAFPTLELFALIWLGDVVGVASADRRRLSWAQAAGLHPAMRLLASDAASLPPTGLAAAGRALGNVCSWALLRQQAIDRGWSLGGCTPELAAWFDDGSFARWAVGCYPPLDVLLEEAADALVPSALRRARSTLGAWSLLPS